ncbi:Syntaxin-like protein 4 [Elsinoe fawcettii]|nr:Syntaxin-like protein 4 [Elsinoe fawcettii]
MATSAHQLFLLADHIKLTLLERQRASSLSLPTTAQTSQISRSLESLRDGLASLGRQKFDQEAAGEDISDLESQISRLQSQYDELEADFSSSSPSDTTKTPNDPALEQDFAAAQSRPQGARSSSLRKAAKSPGSKAVRFRDNPSAEEEPYRDDVADDANRAALFDNKPYSDEPSGPDQENMDNQQIHTYHKQVLRDQDDQLDRLGASIGRQRDLSIQMGNELDDQAVLLDDVDQAVDRHQGTLDRAKGRLNKISRGAKDNWSWVTIGCLILILVLLIVLLK